MRILIIGPARSIALEQWVDEMTHRGHEVAIMSPDVPRPGLAALSDTTEAGPRLPMLRFISRLFRIRRKVREFKPDVVHGHGALDYGLWAVLAGHNPSLVSCWGSDVLVAPLRSRRLRWKVRYALRQADYVTATSVTLLDAAEQLAGRKLLGEAISWGVDTSTFYPAEPNAGRQATVFLSVRALEPLYNIDTIIRAFAPIAEMHSSARLVVAGKGSQDKRLEGLARELGISDSVRFAGWVDQNQLPGLYRSADVYLSVPSSDASAVSNLEAMASGLGIIASNLPSTREWIRDGLEGLLVQHGDVDSLHEAMVRLMNDSRLRRRLADAARERVVSIGQRSRSMDRASDLYERLARGEALGSGRQ